MSQSDMITGEAAKRYAGAFLELAQDAKALKSAEKDFKSLKATLAASDKLSQRLSRPVTSAEDKTGVLLAVAKKAKLTKLTTQFIGTVAANGRAQDLREIMTAFTQKLDALRGTQSVQVMSAKKLSTAQLTAIKAQIKKSIGSDISVETEIDPSLLGGFAVKIGSRYFDNSLKTKLEGMKLAMKEA